VPLHADAFGTTPAAVVVSPGIRWDHPTLVELRNSGVSIKGEVELAFQASGDVPWIGITGTNGKTTVTHLVSHLLKHAGLDAPMGGNVGFSGAELVLELLERGDPQPNWLVMELSSYQIESAPQIAPRVGIWTTLTPDHLERHGTIEAYRAIKRSLLERSTAPILNADDGDLRVHATGLQRAIWVTAGSREDLAPTIQPSLWIEAGQVWQAHKPGDPGPGKPPNGCGLPSHARRPQPPKHAASRRGRARGWLKRRPDGASLPLLYRRAPPARTHPRTARHQASTTTARPPTTTPPRWRCMPLTVR
jgi:UDP-N-acetylmuramoylalanine-D-glutamate ligase